MAKRNERSAFHLDRLEGNKAIFKDGHEQETDAVILMHGISSSIFLLYLKILSLKTGLIDCTHLKLYKGVVWQNNHKLMYLGMQDQFHTFNMFDCQAWVARDIIMGKIKIPDTTQI